MQAAADVSQPGPAAEHGLNSLDPAAIRRLRARISGLIITPDSAEYGPARMVFNRAFDRHPALIVRCADASDVVRTLDFVQKQNLPVAVRGGGHNRAGFGVCDGGVVIDLSKMNPVDVDPGKGVASAAAGALVRDLDQATQRYGLATTSGGCPTVGIAGLTLGGGEGFLMSKYGAACDNLLSAQLVTADGRQVEASQSSNPDLFWAIRGGGGNFGVVTALEYQLHPVTNVLAGTLMYPPGQIAELLQGFVKLVAAAPDELNMSGDTRSWARTVVVSFAYIQAVATSISSALDSGRLSNLSLKIAFSQRSSGDMPRLSETRFSGRAQYFLRVKKLMKGFLFDRVGSTVFERCAALLRFTDSGGNRKVITNVDPGAKLATCCSVDKIASSVRYILTPAAATTAGWPGSNPAAVK
jgi:FAD binding domain